jgi:hypothetical protein
VTLTWRSAVRLPELEAANPAPAAPARRGAAATPEPATTSVTARATAAALADPRVAARPAAALPTFELDRIAEDVMRRIDRRLRIERERRGG